MTLPITERLIKAASLVGRSPFSTEEHASYCGKRCVVADIGCDHAYLSIYLLQARQCDAVIAADLRKGPLASAKQNIEAFGFSDKIQTVLTNGLDGIEVYQPTDIVICGMGGDTIIDILARAPFIKQKGIRLILQPQTSFSELAVFLVNEGFTINAERFALEKNKPYRVIAADYSGIGTTLSLKDALIGKLYWKEDREAHQAFIRKIVNTLDKKIQGALIAHHDPEGLINLKKEITSDIFT